MIGTYARRLRAPDYPWAPTREQREAFFERDRRALGRPGRHRGAGAERGRTIPAFRDWWAAYLRMGASPAAAVALTQMNAEIDVRHILPTIRVPTLVLHRTRRSVPAGRGGALRREPDSRRAVRRAAGRRSPAVCRRSGRDARRDRAVSRGGARTRRFGSGARDDPVRRCGPSGPPARANRPRLDGRTPSRSRGRAASRFGGSAVAVEDGRVFVVFDGPARAIRCGCAIGAEARRD